MSNVFSIVANPTGYTNIGLNEADYPLTNLTGIFAGPLSTSFRSPFYFRVANSLSSDAEQYVPFLAPNTSAVSAGGQGVFVASSLNTSLTASSAPAPVNLTALGQQVPAAGYPNGSTSAPGPASSSNSSTNTSGAGRTTGDVVSPRTVVVALVAVAIASVCGLVV